MNFQYVATARLLRAGETRPDRPRLHAAMSPARARHHDEQSEAAEAERRESHQTLLTRDHVIGLEAQTAAALTRQRAAEEKMSRLNARARRLRDLLDDLIEEVDRLPSWRGSRTLRERAHEARSPRGRDA
jgi:hypothetical protein